MRTNYTENGNQQYSEYEIKPGYQCYSITFKC